MKRLVAKVVMTTLLAGSLPPIAAAQEPGPLEAARLARRGGDAQREAEAFRQLFVDLQNPIGDDTLLLWVYAGLRAGREADVQPAAVRYVLEHRDGLERLNRHPVLAPDERRDLSAFLAGVAGRIPAIDGLILSTPSVFPFGARDAMRFDVRLRSAADVTATVDGVPVGEQRLGSGDGAVPIRFNWDWATKPSLAMTFASKNEVAQMVAGVSVTPSLRLPTGLELRDGRFEVPARPWKSETRMARKRSKFFATMTILCGVAAAVLLKGESDAPDWQNEEYRKAGLGYVFAGSLFALGWAKVGAKRPVPDDGAISYNRATQVEIERLKTEIRVDLAARTLPPAEPAVERSGAMAEARPLLEALIARRAGISKELAVPASSLEQWRHQERQLAAYRQALSEQERILRGVAEQGGDVAWQDEHSFRAGVAAERALRQRVEQDRTGLEAARMEREFQALVQQKREAAASAESGALAALEALASVLSQIVANREAAGKQGVAHALAQVDSAAAELQVVRGRVQTARAAQRQADLDRQFAALSARRLQLLDAYTRAFGTSEQRGAAERLLELLEEMRRNRTDAAGQGDSRAAAQATSLQAEIDRLRKQQ